MSKSALFIKDEIVNIPHMGCRGKILAAAHYTGFDIIYVVVPLAPGAWTSEISERKLEKIPQPVRS